MKGEFYKELNDEIEGPKFPKYMTLLMFAILFTLVILAKMGVFEGW